ncbi:MAG TPA: small, acid-soluble spore protein, alpha/beta type [Clostridiales bacterium]|nr:small, acid-soluble spore protein, alpha/beta type [Clostridiales bacterium]
MLPIDVRLKYEVADELGLLEKIKVDGFKGLSASETGKIGAIMKKRLNEYKKNNPST